MFRDFSELNNLAIPFVGSDLTAGSDVIGAITPKIAHRSLVSIEASSAQGPGVTAFTKWYGALYKGAPLSGSNYAYDAVMELALAMQRAQSIVGAKYNNAISSVTDPKGVPVSTWRAGLAALKKHKSIEFVGAGGPASFDKFHNAVGAFEAFRSKATSVQQQPVEASASGPQEGKRRNTATVGSKVLMDATHKLAAFAAGLRFGDLPQAVAERTKIILPTRWPAPWRVCRRTSPA